MEAKEIKKSTKSAEEIAEDLQTLYELVINRIEEREQELARYRSKVNYLSLPSAKKREAQVMYSQIKDDYLRLDTIELVLFK